MRVSPARKAAFDILFRVEVDKAFSTMLLDRAAEALSPADLALCYEITLGTLRRKIYLDAVIDRLSTRKQLDIEIRVALRLGLFQLLFLERIPAYSAIDDSVNLAVYAGKRSAKPLVNAVLRAAQRGVPAINFSDNIDEVAIKTSHPRWLVKKWIEDFGFATAGALCLANNELPRPAFRLTAASSKAAEAVAAQHRASEVTAGCFIAEKSDRVLREMAKHGEIYLQDEASQMVANSVALVRGGRVLDVCAAPGGKTASIAARLAKSAEKHLVVAGDVSPSRVETLVRTCRSQKVGDVQLVRYDASIGLPFAEASFDHVLVDAPCSGTGTIRRNPEIRYRLSPDDFYPLQTKQLKILQNASKLLAARGSLIYSTCSLEREENEDVCDLFLESSPGFSRVTPSVGPRFLTERGFARTFPHRDAMDGFFVAEFSRS